MTDTPGDDRTLHGDATPLPAVADAHHVDITDATAQFNELQRVLSVRSQQAASERTQSTNGKDLEKGGNNDEEAFDLRAYLTSSNDQTQAAGIAHKHVGVTWENLHVAGFGGAGHKVSPSAAPPQLLANRRPVTRATLYTDLYQDLRSYVTHRLQITLELKG